MRARLDEYQLELIGEVASIPESALCAVFGRQGRMLRTRARGIDPRPVLSPEQQSEFRVVHTLTSDTNDLAVLHPLLRLLSERLGSRLRRRGLIAGRLRVEATYTDYTTASRMLPLGEAVLDAELWTAARRALALASTKRLAVRSLTLTLDQLMQVDTQLELWEGKTGSGEAEKLQHTQQGSLLAGDFPASPLPHSPTSLQHAIDRIRMRYGAGALRSSLRADCGSGTTR
jgi:nucleotidyltransferase/DNA polymerase involved in DNA repair